jgi:RNA polymerase sigma-70 factor, ECF subfamily
VEEKITSGVPRAEKPFDETKLIELAQNGDGRAFGQLIRLHQKRLFRFIYGLTGSFDQAEDIVQEAFVKAYGAINTFRQGASFYPWLSTIARNLAYNQITRQEKKESLEELSATGYDPASTDLGPLDKLMDDQAQRRFYEALAALPTAYRTVFVLRHFEEMEYTDIASYLKIPPGTVDSRLYRARKLLMEQLKDLLE